MSPLRGWRILATLSNVVFELKPEEPKPVRVATKRGPLR